MTNKERCKNCIHKAVCTYQDYFDNVDHLGERCKQYMSKDIINRQKAKIEALEMDKEQLKSDFINVNMNCEHLLSEIERLQGFADNMEYCANHALDDLEKEKAEAIKEFAERLKEKAFPDDSISCEMVVYAENIDNLVKEMAGERE